jgi:protein gp37
MADHTRIAWCDATFNPWMGCIKVSPGCTHCYAETWVRRTGGRLWGPDSQRQVTSPSNWANPLSWNRKAERAGRPSTVFCGSLCDVFEDHPTAEATRPRLFDLIRRTPWLTWLLLTKRSTRIADCLPADWGEGYANVWLGVSVEDRRYGLPRIDDLRQVPAVLRFLSVEPLLEDLGSVELTGIGWVIVGGESGSGFRPMDHAWVRPIRDRCLALGVPFFFKQSSGSRSETGIELDGEIVRQYPARRESLPQLC